jgi:hypothetical protein
MQIGISGLFQISNLPIKKEKVRKYKSQVGGKIKNIV